MASKVIRDDNYLTAENGCVVVSCTSEHQRGPASNLLIPNDKLLWVTTEPLPQECTISLKKSIHKPSHYNTIGFYCWHQFDSNPALIEILGKDISEKWQIISKVRMSATDGWQYFKFEEVAADKIQELKIRILENFGDSKTYLNQISLHHAQLTVTERERKPDYLSVEAAADSYKFAIREKTHSDYHKQTVSERQLKKANEKIKQLTEEQQLLKVKVNSQQKIILKMQQTLHRLLISVQKMGGIEPSSKNISRNNSHQGKFQEKDKNTQIEKQLNEILGKFQKIKPQKEMLTITNKANKRATTHQPFNQDIVRMDSDDSLSQYSQNNQKFSIGSKKGTNQISAMKKKLKYLQTLRQLKQSELKKSGSQQGKWKRQCQYESDDSSFPSAGSHHRHHY